MIEKPLIEVMVEVPLHTLEWLLTGLHEGKVAASPYSIRDSVEYDTLWRTVAQAGGQVPWMDDSDVTDAKPWGELR